MIPLPDSRVTWRWGGYLAIVTRWGWQSITVIFCRFRVDNVTAPKVTGTTRGAGWTWLKGITFIPFHQTRGRVLGAPVRLFVIL